MMFIIIVAFTNPNENIIYTAISISFLAFFSATQDISVDAFRIESAPKNMQGPLSSMYIAGYRISMIVSGAGSLWLASYFGGENYDLLVWRKVYLTMSMLMIIGILTVIYSNEPTIRRRKLQINNHISFIIFVFISILSFGIIYNYLDNPFQKSRSFFKFYIFYYKNPEFVLQELFYYFTFLFFLLKIINQKTISKIAS